MIGSTLGVACTEWIQVEAAAGALSVGVTVLAMCYLRCLHPPGAAVALIAVCGGPEVQALGYQLVLIALLSAASLVFGGLIFNYSFPWRRYPASLIRHPEPSESYPASALAVEDFRLALECIDSYIDISPEDLEELVVQARNHAAQRRSAANDELPDSGHFSTERVG